MAGFSSPVTRLRVASCPAMEQHITVQQQTHHTPPYAAAAGDGGGSCCSVPPDGSSSGRSVVDGGVSVAASSPVCATSGLSASAAAGLSFSGSFLRSLRGSQPQQQQLQGSLKAAAPGR